MASDIMHYVNASLQTTWTGTKPPLPPPDTQGCILIPGLFRDPDSDIFMSIHPNKSVSVHTTAPVHRHDYVELVYVYKGSLKHTVNGRSMPLKEGSVSLLNVGATHQPHVDTAEDIVMNLGIRTERIQSILSSVSERSGTNLNPFSDALFGARSGKQKACLQISDSSTINDLLDEMFCEYHRGDTLSQKVLSADLVRLLVELYRRDDSPNLPDLRDQENMESTIRNYIQAHYAALTMDDLCRRFNYSERHMRRMLRGFSEDGLRGMLNQIRIEKACAYIDEFNMPTHEIMRRVGFNDTSYFYRIFKKITGMSIAEYRNR